MKSRILFLAIACFVIFGISAFGQKTAPVKAIFAVLSEGKILEPVAFVENGKLRGIGEQGDNPVDVVKTFYKSKSKYNLIFGGVNQGSVIISKDLAGTECAANQAEIAVVSKNFKPKPFLMALGTNLQPKVNSKLIRKMPTANERKSINELVVSEMKTKNVPVKNAGELRYHNLTKLDVDGDGRFEFVGTYWYNTGVKQRSLLFFIAETDSDGTFSIPFSKFQDVAIESVMSGEINDVDDGIYHELLIDMLDFDADGQSEIFTMSRGFEGSNFNAYKRVDGKWTQVLETSSYHCGY